MRVGSPKSSVKRPARVISWSRRFNAVAIADALVARMSVQPSAPRKQLINDLIASLVSNGVWGSLDILYVTAAHDAQAARLNWVANEFNATAVGVPPFVVDQGYTGSSVDYLGTGYTPITAGRKLVLGSAHFGAWSNTATGGSTPSIGTGIGADFDLHLDPFITAKGSTFSHKINSVTVLATANTTGIGFYSVDRSGDSVSRYKNGGPLFSPVTQVPGGLASGEFKIGSFTTVRQWTAFCLGSSLGDTKQAALYSALRTYMTAVGVP